MRNQETNKSKLSLNKFKIAKIHNMTAIKGGVFLGINEDGDSGKTGTSPGN